MSSLYPDHALEQHSPSPKLGKLSDKEGNKASVDLKCKGKGRGSEAKAPGKDGYGLPEHSEAVKGFTRPELEGLGKARPQRCFLLLF